MPWPSAAPPSPTSQCQWRYSPPPWSYTSRTHFKSNAQLLIKRWNRKSQLISWIFPGQPNFNVFFVFCFFLNTSNLWIANPSPCTPRVNVTFTEMNTTFFSYLHVMFTTVTKVKHERQIWVTFHPLRKTFQENLKTILSSICSWIVWEIWNVSGSHILQFQFHSFQTNHDIHTVYMIWPFQDASFTWTD